MRALPAADRKRLEAAVLAARRASESACRAAIDALGVFADKRPDHLDTHQAALRNGLRAKWRQLDHDRELLVAECAYEQWHRLLFARFLAENDLLLHPQYEAPVTLQDCAELADEIGEPDAWSVAARFASEILPGIFRLDDPCVRLRLPPEGRHALEQILDGLPAETFAADDALGWVYQFWQKDEKDAVNAAEISIDGVDLGPVTQLFTENYMVRFLLENSLGAWWAARHPDSPIVAEFDYLRPDGERGSSEGWPDRAADVTMIDPCCGSGHFLVGAFTMLWRMRVEEDGLQPIDAQDAVLRENLFGLEIDARCVQIAMFALALTAWKAAGRWRRLPMPNIACSGVPVATPIQEWRVLAGEDDRLKYTLERLHGLFADAENLGSLIDPRQVSEDSGMYSVGYGEVANELEHLLPEAEVDAEAHENGVYARGIAWSSELLSRRYTLVSTNVPYLGANRQSGAIRRYLAGHHPDARADLATAFLDRWMRPGSVRGSIAVVLPQTFLYLRAFSRLRDRLLGSHTFSLAARLGAGAFDGISGHVVQAALVVADPARPTPSSEVSFIDVSSSRTSFGKARELAGAVADLALQKDVRSSPRSVIAPTHSGSGDLLADFVRVHYGSKPGQTSRVTRRFWEFSRIALPWVRLESRPDGGEPYSGKTECILHPEAAWRRGVAEFGVRGREAWGDEGILVSKMSSLPSSLYCGEIFDDNTYVLVPRRRELLEPIFDFVRSERYRDEVRSRNQKLAIDTESMVNVPIDIAFWAERSNGRDVPKRHSSDPTQWLFDGRASSSTDPLQVAVAQLLGFRWPEQAEVDDRDPLLDNDGIVCLPAVAGEEPAADRVQRRLASDFGDSWSPAVLRDLLERQPGRSRNLADWLRDDFFRRHCQLFGNRPFVWHIWDGLRDGFSVLVNYHKLDGKVLAKLTYSYLGQDWVERQRAGIRDEVAGAEARLSAALELKRKLELILDGEQPYDIYVRWKELHEQSIGWEPDLNDGVRLNIRPFVVAGVLRAPFNIHWNKDRGKNPDGSERHNDVHLSLAEKQEARRQVGRT